MLSGEVTNTNFIVFGLIQSTIDAVAVVNAAHNLNIALQGKMAMSLSNLSYAGHLVERCLSVGVPQSKYFFPEDELLLNKYNTYCPF